jgi:hypothetical protein
MERPRINKFKAGQLTAETIREMGILVAVFAPLDAYFQREAPAPGSLIALVTVALLAIGVGITIEARE